MHFFFRACERAFFPSSDFYDENIMTERLAIISAYLPYVEAQRIEGVRLPRLLRPLLSLFNGVSGSKQWRRMLTAAIQQGDDKLVFRLFRSTSKNLLFLANFYSLFYHMPIEFMLYFFKNIISYSCLSHLILA
ncbi:MAG: hypothetical protein LRY43_00375 [Gammaproteobacteria bacterium]|nr:hypothetical protein [Gammaproteobacteria bacterium]